MAEHQKPEALRRAEGAIDRATGAPDERPKYAEGTDESGNVEALEGEQRSEAGQTWPEPPMPISTGAQGRGMLIGSLIGGAIGLVLLLPLGFIPISGLSLTGRLVLCAIIGAFAGGTAGAMYLGGRLPELEGETVDADGRPSVGSTLRDPRSDDRGR
ncbi:MAG: hypothetical protein ACR2G7_05880 [Acidimicrobiales bacterium]